MTPNSSEGLTPVEPSTGQQLLNAQSSATSVRTTGNDTVPEQSKVQIVAHFRRHTDWVGYMQAENENDQMKYGFDWLGDNVYDFDDPFGQTDPFKQSIARNYSINNRYGYIEKHEKNFSPDIQENYKAIETLAVDQSDNKTAPIVWEDGGIWSPMLEIVAKKIDDYKYRYKDEYQQHATLTTINGVKYFPSYLNVRAYNEIKLYIGIKHINSKAEQFGTNNDEIYLRPKPGYEGKFKIDPEMITKDMFGKGQESAKQKLKQQITLAKKNLVNAMAIETISQNSKEPDKDEKLKNAVRRRERAEYILGDLKEQLFCLDNCIEIKITNTDPLDTYASILAYHTDKNTPGVKGSITDITNSTNIIGELIIYPNKEYKVALCWLIKVKRSKTAYPDTDDFGSGHNNYDIDKIKKSLIRVLAQCNIEVNIEEKESNEVMEKVNENTSEFLNNALNYFLKNYIPGSGDEKDIARESLRTSKKIFMFLHDYEASDDFSGWSNVEPTIPKTGYANTVMVFSDGDTMTLSHEVIHSMGCNHTFSILEIDDVDFGGDMGLNKGVAVFFDQPKERCYLYQMGRTDNIIDYNYGCTYDSGIVAKDPTFYKKISTYNNPYNRCSLYKWQWTIINKDDELECKVENLPA